MADINSVLVLGYFDSVHLGHRKLIEQAKKDAVKRGVPLRLLTFGDDFLSAMGRNEKEVFLLKERRLLYRNCGVDAVTVLPTDKHFLSCGKKEFCDFLLRFRPVSVFAGEDYRFAKNAEGNTTFLSEYLGKFGIECNIFPLYKENNEKISSSIVRKCVENGDAEAAYHFLSVPFFIVGEVIRGRGDGRRETVPTVNIALPKGKAVPKYGVYITETEVEGVRYRSVTNVGAHPTFGDEKENIETFLLDFSEEIYGKEITILFYKYIRPIRTFTDTEELKRQIMRDVALAKEYKL